MIYIFNSTRDAIRAEGILRKTDLKFRVVPVPKNISAECGMAIETEMILETDTALDRGGIAYKKHER